MEINAKIAQLLGKDINDVFTEADSQTLKVKLQENYGTAGLWAWVIINKNVDKRFVDFSGDIPDIFDEELMKSALPPKSVEGQILEFGTAIANFFAFLFSAQGLALFGGVILLYLGYKALQDAGKVNV
jgi:hypothetical protein